MRREGCNKMVEDEELSDEVLDVALSLEAATDNGALSPIEMLKALPQAGEVYPRNQADNG